MVTVTVNYGWPVPQVPGASQIVEMEKVAATIVAADAKIKAFEAAYLAHVHTFEQITQKPTTIAGFGINDAMTTTQTTSAISAAIAALRGGVPAALDTLKLIGDAIGNDPAFSETVQEALDGKAPTIHSHSMEQVNGLPAALDARLLTTSYTATDILTKLKTVDGVNSGLDADLLDGQHGSYYRDLANATGALTTSETIVVNANAYIRYGLLLGRNAGSQADIDAQAQGYIGVYSSGTVAIEKRTTPGGPATSAISLNGDGVDNINHTAGSNSYKIWTDGNTQANDITAKLGFTPANGANSINAGNGLTGGGTYGASRTIAMGTPGTLTASTGNSVQTDSHTHAVDEDSIVSVGMAALGTGAVGTYAFLTVEGDNNLNPGATRSGADLRYTSADGDDNGGNVSGTWRCMGRIITGDRQSNTTLFLRIS